MKMEMKKYLTILTFIILFSTHVDARGGKTCKVRGATYGSVQGYATDIRWGGKSFKVSISLDNSSDKYVNVEYTIRSNKSCSQLYRVKVGPQSNTPITESWECTEFPPDKKNVGDIIVDVEGADCDTN
jgi:hypothetical protein